MAEETDGMVSWAEAIGQVLSDVEDHLHYKEIAKRIVDRGLRRKTDSIEVHVGYQLSHSIKELGSESPYERVGRVGSGLYRLRNRADRDVGRQETGASQGRQQGVLAAYGMYWDRDDVDWRRQNPKLLGRAPHDSRKAAGAPVDVNFCDQSGVYLLHDHREVIYIGRATSKTLGQRLLAHTKDRLRGRWQYFSWFGFRPVIENSLGPALDDFPAGWRMGDLIGMVEAILIEAIEPRKNMRGGDNMKGKDDSQVKAIEFEQTRDQSLNEEIFVRRRP